MTIMTNEHSIYVIVVCGALLNFLPFTLGYSLRNPETHLFPQYLKGLKSPQLTNSLVASLSMSFPILLDYFFDCLASLLKHFKVNTSFFLNHHDARSSVCFPFQEMIFFIVIPDALFLFWIIPYEKYDILAGLLSARDTMIIYSFLAYMVRYKNPIWTWWTTIPIIASILSANIILTMQLQFDDSFSNNIEILFSILLPFLVSTALLILTVNMIRWFLFVKRMAFSGKNENDIKFVLCTVCAVCYYIFILGDWLLFYAPKSTSPMWSSILGFNYLTMCSYLMAGSTVIISIVSSRLTRIESQESKVCL